MAGVAWLLCSCRGCGGDEVFPARIRMEQREGVRCGDRQRQDGGERECVCVSRTITSDSS